MSTNKDILLVRAFFLLILVLLLLSGSSILFRGGSFLTRSPTTAPFTRSTLNNRQIIKNLTAITKWTHCINLNKNRPWFQVRPFSWSLWVCLFPFSLSAPVRHQRTLQIPQPWQLLVVDPFSWNLLWVPDGKFNMLNI